MTKYLGLDLGSVTCGVSWSETGFIARTVKTLRFPSDDYDTAIEKVEELVAEMKPDIIVLGLPLLENGDVAERAQICLEFGRALEVETGIPVKTIQQYEQRRKDINKAQVEYVVRLSKALCCEPQDILEVK